MIDLCHTKRDRKSFQQILQIFIFNGSRELYVYKYIIKKIYDKKSTSIVEVLLPVFYLRTN
jgi:hypothetical protein